MLALKSVRVPAHASGRKPVDRHLPPEILDLVIEYIYKSSLRQLESIIPFSLVCRQFRASALPILFDSVSCVIRDDARQLEHALLRRLLEAPHLLGHVRKLEILHPLWKEEGEGEGELGGEEDAKLVPKDVRAADLEIVRRCLPFMQNLQCLRYVYTTRSFCR